MLLFVADLFWLIWAGIFCNRLWRLLRFGRSPLIFASFPFQLGQELRVTLVQAGRLRGCQTLRLTLRCIEEVRLEWKLSSGRSRSELVCDALYEDCQTLQAEHLSLSHGSQLEISFPLPADAPPTMLSQYPPRYWELEISADTQGMAYTGLFFVPVY